MPVTDGILCESPFTIAYCLRRLSVQDLLFGAVPIVFEQTRGWNTLEGTLPFLAVLAGTLTSASINIFYSAKIFGPHVDSHGGHAKPEMRLPPMSASLVQLPPSEYLQLTSERHSVGGYHLSDRFLSLRLGQRAFYSLVSICPCS